MARIIKFRMWDVENRQMVDGDSLAFEEYAPLCELLKDTDTQKFMQFISNDEYGKEVYEGDIVKMHYFFPNGALDGSGIYEDENEIIGIVQIDDFGIYLETKDGSICYWSYYLQELEAEIEVVGNIYQQPELIKGWKYER